MCIRDSGEVGHFVLLLQRIFDKSSLGPRCGPYQYGWILLCRGGCAESNPSLRTTGVLKGLLGLLIERGLHGNQDCSGDHGANHDVQAEQRDVVGGKGDDKATVRDVAVDALELSLIHILENQVGWHGKAPNDEQFEQAMAELAAAGEEL